MIITREAKVVRIGIVLIIIGLGSFSLQFTEWLRNSGILAQYQPLVGSLLIVTGIGFLWYNFLDNRKAKGTASSGAAKKAVEEYYNTSVAGQPQPVATPTARYSQPAPAPSPVSASTPSASEQEYINRLAYGIQLAQNGSKEEANRLLNELFLIRPNDTTLLMWLAFTSSDLTTSRNYINRIAQLEPNNPTLPNAQQWLATQESQAKF
jgi:hypothetical protein